MPHPTRRANSRPCRLRGNLQPRERPRHCNFISRPHLAPANDSVLHSHQLVMAPRKNPNEHFGSCRSNMNCLNHTLKSYKPFNLTSIPPNTIPSTYPARHNPRHYHFTPLRITSDSFTGGVLRNVKTFPKENN